MSRGYILKCVNTPCCDYVLAVPCPDQVDPPDIYIRRDKIGDFHYFIAGGLRQAAQPGAKLPALRPFCYSIDPDGPGIKPPHDYKSQFQISGAIADCAACITNVKGGGGGGVIYVPPGDDPRKRWGWPVTLCAGEPVYGGSEFWALYDLLPVGSATPASGASDVRIFRYADRCWSYDAGDSPALIPDGTASVWVFGSYQDCDDCRKVLAAYPCPGQGANLPTIYVRPERYLDSSGVPLTDDIYIFRFGGGCYTLDPSAGLILPVGHFGGIVINNVGGAVGSSDFTNCDDCTHGVEAIICPDTDPAIKAISPRLWIPKDRLPETALWFRFQKACYSIDPAEELVFCPDDALQVVATDSYSDCSNCKCGVRSNVHGIKAELCAGQAGAVKEAWIIGDVAPTDDRYFEWKRYCWKISAGTIPAFIPSGADIITSDFGSFDDCATCLDHLTNPDDPPDRPPPLPPPPIDPPPFPPPKPPIGPPLPPGWPPDPPPGGPPPRPPWDKLPPVGPPGGNPPPINDSLLLVKCSDGTFTGGAVRKIPGIAGKVILDGDDCLRVSAVETNGAAFPPLQIFQSCQQCELSKRWIELVDCRTGVGTGIYAWKLEYIQGGGALRPVYLYGPNLCATATGAEVIVRPASVISGPRFPDCFAAACAAACGSCIGSTPATWLATFTGVANGISKIAGECAYGFTVVGGGDTLDSYPLTQSTTDACLWEYSGPGPTLIIDGVSYNHLYIAYRKNAGIGSGFSMFALLLDTPASVAPLLFYDDGTNISDDCCANQSLTNNLTAYNCGVIGIGGSVLVSPAC